VILVRSPGGRLRACGAREGTFIRIIQGFASTSGIPRLDDPERRPGQECFVVLAQFEKPPWGSGVFRVDAEGALIPVVQNYDSSD
jgi:hypothetical protein